MSAATMLWFAAALFTTAVGTFALSRPFRIEKLSIFGIEAALKSPIVSKGRPWLAFIAGAVLLGAMTFGLLGVKATLLTPVWPTKLRQVRTAELQVSEIDDYVDVSVNGKQVMHAEWGEAPPWVSIKDELRRGPNAIEIRVTNGQYGGCGANVFLRMNGVTDPAFSWTWKQHESQMPGVVCFRTIKTLNLD